jgi:cell wall-associated NlpC family hydrolase
VVRTRVDGGGRTRIRTWALTTVAAVLVVLLPGTVANASPSPQEIEAQIAQVWNESEPLIEQYNAIHQQFQQNQAKQAELEAALAPLQAQLAAAQVKVGAIAAQAYRGSGTGNVAAFLGGDSPGLIADKLAFLDRFARDEASELAGAAKLKADFDAQKAPIDQLVTELAVQDKDLADKKAVITARLDELQNLRRQAYASSGGTGSFRPWPCPATYAPTAGYTAAAFACAQAGVPYVWAAAGPSGYDCSGLTLAAWQQVGVYLPHNAAAQRRSMPYVDKADLQVGDLVFYYSDLHHVAIYVGDGKIMQAPQAGDNVRMSDMNFGPIHSFGRPG